MTAEKQQAINFINGKIQDFSTENMLAVKKYVIALINKQPEPEKKLAADGILHHLADPSKIPFEKEAWPKAAAAKYWQKMEKKNEAD